MPISIGEATNTMGLLGTERNLSIAPSTEGSPSATKSLAQEQEITSSAPAWTRTDSSSMSSMGRNGDYGVQGSPQVSSWKALSPFRRKSNSNSGSFQDSSLDLQDSQQDEKSTSRWFQSSRTISETSIEIEEPNREEERKLDRQAQKQVYADMVQAFPSTITFVVRCFRPPPTSAQSLLDLVGVQLVKNQTTHRFEVVRDEVGHESDDSPLLPPELTVLLRPGDVLETVNNRTVGGKALRNPCKDEEALYKHILASTESLQQKPQTHNGNCFCYYTLTLTFSCGTEPAAETEETPSGRIHQAYLVDKGIPGEDDKSMTNDESDSFLELKTEDKVVIHKNPNGRKPTELSLLHIASIPENNWLEQQSRIQAGDIILSINETQCCDGEITSTDLSLLWRTALLTKTSRVSLKTFRKPPTRLQSIRKAAVAVSGGALVGTGAVLMVTPLHPVGHAMTIGGLGVLGTEFEAPKKAVKSVRRSFTNFRQRNSDKSLASKDDSPSKTLREEPME